MAVFQVVRIHTEAPEWLWWLRNGFDQERKKGRGERAERGIVMSDVLRTHVTNDMLDNNIKVGLGGPQAGYSSVVVQQVGDSQ